MSKKHLRPELGTPKCGLYILYHQLYLRVEINPGILSGAGYFLFEPQFLCLPNEAIKEISLWTPPTRLSTEDFYDILSLPPRHIL